MIPGYLDKCVERGNCIEALGILSHREQDLLSLVYLHLEEVFFELPYCRVVKKLPLDKKKVLFRDKETRKKLGENKFYKWLYPTPHLKKLI